MIAARVTAFAMMRSGETRTSSPSARSALSRRTRSIMPVTSTSTPIVTCGEVNAEVTIALAMAFFTPLTGTRSSRDAFAAEAPAPTLAAAAPAAAAPAVAPTAAAPTAAPPAVDVPAEPPDSRCARRSDRVTSPRAPVGVTAARSTPCSFASFRTGGFAIGRLSPPACGAPPAAEEKSSGGGTAAAGAAGAAPPVAGLPDGAGADGAAAPPAAALRGRRRDDEATAP